MLIKNLILTIIERAAKTVDGLKITADQDGVKMDFDNGRLAGDMFHDDWIDLCKESPEIKSITTDEKLKDQACETYLAAFELRFSQVSGLQAWRITDPDGEDLTDIMYGEPSLQNIAKQLKATYGGIGEFGYRADKMKLLWHEEDGEDMPANTVADILLNGDKLGHVQKKEW